MSQVIRFGSGALPPGTFVETLTGNTGGPVGPDGAGNINVVGSGNINVAGNPGTFTETITIVGTTNHALQVGNAAGSLTSLPVAANGQIPIGSAGADPVIANITAGAGIVVTNGAGSITLSTNGSVVVTTLHTQDGNNVTPTAGVININGAGGLATTGTVGPNTVTITAGGTIAQSFPTDAGTATPAAGVLNIIANRAGLGSGSSVFFSAPGAANTVQLNVTDALSNTLVGNIAGNLTLTGTQNTGLGNNVLHALTTGSRNVGIGSSALNALTSGVDNVAIGNNALLILLDSNGNTAVGAGSMAAFISGSLDSDNTALGSDALQNLTSGDSNIAIGALAGDNLSGAENRNIYINDVGVTGISNHLAVSLASGDRLIDNYGSNNLFLGFNAGNRTLNQVSAMQNYALGGGALASLTIGNDNIGIGVNALNQATTAIENIAIGSLTLSGNVDSPNNIAIGFESTINLTTGTGNNVAIGNTTLHALASGSGNNIAIGTAALISLTTGRINVAIGNGAGSNYTGAESSNILILNDGVLGESNVIRIGTSGTGVGQQAELYFAAPRGEFALTADDPYLLTINTSGAEVGRVKVTDSSLAVWQDLTGGGPFTYRTGAGIFANAAVQVEIQLPAVSPVGDTFSISDSGGNGWKITQAAGQAIRFGNQITTVGVAGFLESTSIGDTVQLVCSIANTLWQVVSVIGNITVN